MKSHLHPHTNFTSIILKPTVSHYKWLVLFVIYTHQLCFYTWMSRTAVVWTSPVGPGCRVRLQPSGVQIAERLCSVPSITEEEEVSAGPLYAPCAKLLSSPSAVSNLEEKDMDRLEHYRTFGRCLQILCCFLPDMKATTDAVSNKSSQMTNIILIILQLIDQSMKCQK